MLNDKTPIKADRFTTDVFTVPFKDGYIFYVPELGIVAGVDERVHDLVLRIKNCEKINETPFNREWLSALRGLGIFRKRKDKINETLSDFSPTQVTLSLTSRCQLACVYCYARAGENIRDMDTDIIDAGISTVVNNALKLGEKSIKVDFHGEGEPTANWRLFCRAIACAEDIVKKNGLGVSFSMSTNGMWGRSQRSFVGKRFRNISLSFDGPPDIQNKQRPTAGGKPSYPVVRDNIKFLEEAGVRVGFRATVLPDSIESMVPFLELVASEFDSDYVHFEPVCPTGRGAAFVDNRYFYRRFVDVFHKAFVVGGNLGINVAYSGCRAAYHSKNFCGYSGPDPNFFVSLTGNVSSCYEISDPESEKGKFTVYGRYDRARRSFIFDGDKLKRIREFGVQKLPHCRGCFARWNCSGDCLVRSDLNMDGNGEVCASFETPRCLANRETTLYDLVRRAVVLDTSGRRGSEELPYVD